MRKKKNFSGAPFLGKIKLHWCDNCNIPILDSHRCDICGSVARKVEITPPGDSFPARGELLKKVRNAIDSIFGSALGLKLLPPDKIILANKSPSQEGMYEFVVDGFVIGKIKYDIFEKKTYFSPTLEGARRLAYFNAKKWILCESDVIQYILNGASLLIPGVLNLDPSIIKGDDVYLIDPSRNVFAVGKARLSYNEIKSKTHGVAVKIREYDMPRAFIPKKGGQSLNLALMGNKTYLKKLENDAISFIKSVKEKFGLPHIVAFSGGKDSLATFLLVRKALGSAPIFFLNTGIEFPETIDYVMRIQSKYNEPLIMTDASDSFWRGVDFFGPPARDYRWCCKVVKFGPASLKLREEYQTQVLTFVGQRRYESFRRSQEKKVSQNIWVREQISVSPIKNWTALDVYLYAMLENAELNPLYSQGFPRIGCWLCPASSLEEFEFLRTTHPELYEKWFNILNNWKSKFEYPDEWVDFGIWRWRHIPKNIKNELNSRNLQIDENIRINETGIHFSITNEKNDVLIKYTKKIEISEIENILTIFGLVKSSSNTFMNEKTKLKIIGDTVILNSDKDVDVYYIARAIQRRSGCQGCGVCVSSCPFGALEIINNKIHVNTDLCTNCLECDESPCPTYLK